jgi:hypothetical protein
LVLFAAVAFFPDVDNRPFFQSAAGLALVTIFIGTKLFNAYGLEVAAGYMLASATFFYEWPLPQLAYRGPTPWGGVGVQSSVESAVLSLTLMATFLALGTDDFFSKIKKILLYFAVVDSGLIIVRGIWKGTWYAYYMLGNSAVDASFLACLLPISGWFSIPMLIAISVTKSSTALGAVGIVAISWLVSKYGIKKMWPVLFAVPALLGAMGYFFLREELFNSNGRFWIWKVVFDYWDKLPKIYQTIGTGTGSFFIYGPTLMHQVDPTTNQSFFWMHNDWLQVLFENGMIGLALLIGIFIKLLCNTEENPKVFAMVCTYGFIGLTQMPLRQFLFQVLGVCLIGLYGKGPSVLVPDSDN